MATKEYADGQEYNGVKIFCFVIECPSCESEMVIRTDPKNSAYFAERNCTAM